MRQFLLISLFEDFQQFHYFFTIIAVCDELLGLLIKRIVLHSSLVQILLPFLGFVALLYDLFLQEHFLALFLVYLNLFGFNGLLVHFRHVAQEERLFSNLAQLFLK